MVAEVGAEGDEGAIGFGLAAYVAESFERARGTGSAVVTAGSGDESWLSIGVSDGVRDGLTCCCSMID